MKSLQVVTPHLKCIFNCPFCISKGHKHMRYIEKTAIGWAEQGISTLKGAKALNSIYLVWNTIKTILYQLGQNGLKVEFWRQKKRWN